jgi:hypothetical protein
MHAGDEMPHLVGIKLDVCMGCSENKSITNMLLSMNTQLPNTFQGVQSFLKGSVTQLFKKLSTFTKPIGSLPRSQKPATELCPQPTESSPHPHPIPKIIVILFFHLCPGLPKVS